MFKNISSVRTRLFDIIIKTNVTRIGPSMSLSFHNWMRLFLAKGITTLKCYFPRVFLINLLNSFDIPFSFYENRRYNKLINTTKLTKPPIFILGHWRSGTSHLHNLLCQDPQFGFLNLLQAAFPKSYLTNKFYSSLIEMYLPKTRPMDNMAFGALTPGEDEMMLGNLFPFSFYNSLYIPCRMEESYDVFISLKRLPKKHLEEWKRNYIYILKKITYCRKGKQLMLKSPANTARIKLLLELFPDAKFIHIYRNPYIIFYSTLHFYRKSIQPFMLQKISDKNLESTIFSIYKEMMNDYFKDKHLIAKQHLVEVKFEDLEEHPVEQLHRIYSHLDLKGFKHAKPYFTKYLDSIKTYKKNKYSCDPQVIEKIQKHWKLTIDNWNYKVPQND
ncbi:MAG: sulfotransferase [Candidatus Hermodarchaeota archaeon]